MRLSSTKNKSNFPPPCGSTGQLGFQNIPTNEDCSNRNEAAKKVHYLFRIKRNISSYLTILP